MQVQLKELTEMYFIIDTRGLLIDLDLDAYLLTRSDQSLTDASSN